jgi:predicted acylesterase/phospholipase RssA
MKNTKHFVAHDFLMKNYLNLPWPKNYKKVLSLDGGGVRVIASIIFLKKLEESTGKSIFELFDYFIGVSAGGANALLIALNELNATELEKFWSQKNLENIMIRSYWDRRTFFQNKPKYKEEFKVNLFKTYFRGSYLKDSKKPVAVLAYDLEKRKPRVIASYTDDKMMSRTVASATSAAPLYYPSVKTEDDSWLIDGGVVANNPCLIGYNEARKYFNTNKIKVFSLGTGINRKKIDGESSIDWGAFGWLRNDIIGVLLESHLDHDILYDLIGDNYLRINSSIGDVNYVMDDYSSKNLAKIRSLGEQWWNKFGSQSLEFIK